ncbi:MAG: L,D-transpeptidase [Candidatus Rhabdochlamydia sp.]
MGKRLRRVFIYSLIILIAGWYFFPSLKQFARQKHIPFFSSLTYQDPLPSQEEAKEESTYQEETLEQPLLFPSVNRIEQLFSKEEDQLPIVETLTYTPAVSWLSGRSAWLGDYAAYYKTPSHFIARSLNGSCNYITPKVSLGKKFNVFKKDKPIQFSLLLDLSQRVMGFYYTDLETKEHVFLRSYPVVIGKKDAGDQESLTPTGKFVLGDKTAVYRPGVKGLFQGKQIEMISIFGTRFIPLEPNFSQKNSLCHFSIHGLPWSLDSESEKWREIDPVLVGDASEGSICMRAEDIEELFSIIVTRPTVIEIVKHLQEAPLFTNESAALQKE